jgi:quercetin dioxygenase-like cupin family protein
MVKGKLVTSWIHRGVERGRKAMQTLVAVFALVLISAALPNLSRAGPAAPALDLHADVLPGTTPQEVILVEHDFDPGDSSGLHIHHGVELAYVLKGALQVTIEGQPPRLVHAGDSFRVERDTPHEVRNVGRGTAALIISYLMDKGVPWKIPVTGISNAPAKP